VKLLIRLCGSAVVAGSMLAQEAPAAALVRDLGQGLAYYRVHTLPADLPSIPGGRPGACVLDLRFAKSDEAAAMALRAWIKFNASARAPVFVLENSETNPAILSSVPEGVAGLLVLAPELAKLGPDIAVRVPPDADRRAYDALEKGAPVESLLSDYPEKSRVDEEYLEKEHLSDSDAPDAEAGKPSAPPPLVDAMLQRAVQLHRGLLALKRI
jgi:hypothetical protein